MSTKIVAPSRPVPPDEPEFTCESTWPSISPEKPAVILMSPPTPDGPPLASISEPVSIVKTPFGGMP